jgi:uncharacterized C2H2 Zn-finger protein
MKSEPYSCDICEMMFVNEKELAKHKAVVHTANNEKMFQCQSCNAFFDSREKFKKHTVELHSEKYHYNIGKTIRENTKKKGGVAKKEDMDIGNSNIENRLLNRVNSKGKARKRTHGPIENPLYRGYT